MEDTKSQVTLIKHVVTQTAPKEETAPAPVEQKAPEKRKIVIVKKKVVVAKKPQPVSAGVPQETEKAEGSQMTEPQQPQTQQVQQQPVVRRNVVRQTTNSPLHNGPMIIHPTNLPPVPGQGQSVKDHAQWQSQNPVGSQESVVPSVGPRQVGIVGGKPVQRPYQNSYNKQYTPRPQGQSGGYQSRPYNPQQNGSGYQPRPYSNQQQQGTGSYQPRPYNNNAGGYQQRQYGNNYGNRPVGQGGFNRPGYGGGRPPFGQRPGYGPRPGFGNKPGQGGRPNNGNGLTELNDQQRTPKKTFRKRADDYKKRDAEEEKEFQIQRRKEQEAAKLAAVPKTIDIMDSIIIADLAKKMNLKASDIIAKLFKMGTMVTINQTIDFDTASIIAGEYGCKVNKISLYEETLIENTPDTPDLMVPRAPIVTIMGHVDHGKTKLLDAIRSTHVAEGEFGGITQHIGAYKVDIPEKGEIVFLDTPGHAAFSMMRARGAQVTDIVVLVVAANDGVMAQTREAIDHAKAAKVPIIVAINKCDLPEANPERVMQQLSDIGLIPEEWGGQTLYCRISALKKQGIDDLLDTILLQAEMMELKANASCRAEGKVLEARIDQGRGIVATVLIQKGTLRVGDYYVAGIYPGRARAIFNDKGKKIEEAGPSTPVEIMGLSDVPNAGDPFQVTEDEKQARTIGTKRQELERLGDSSNVTNKITLANLGEKIAEGNIKTLDIVIKGDVQGSVEALQGALEKLSTPEIKLEVIRAAAGAIIESDVSLAAASNALIIGFNVRPTPRALALASEEKIEIRKYNIIYDVVDDVKAAMEGMLSPITKEVDIGTAEVRETFHVPKIGLIAGCMVISGKITRDCFVRVIRDNIQISKDLIKLSSLKRFKDDAKEVAEGFECGIGLEDYQDLQVGDVLEAVGMEKIARKLDDGKGPVAAEEPKK